MIGCFTCLGVMQCPLLDGTRVKEKKNRERSHASSLLKGKCLSDLPSMIDLCVSIDLREFLEFSEIKEIQMKRPVGS